MAGPDQRPSLERDSPLDDVGIGVVVYPTLRFLSHSQIREVWRFTFGSLFQKKKERKKEREFLLLQPGFHCPCRHHRHWKCCGSGGCSFRWRAGGSILDVGQRCSGDDDKRTEIFLAVRYREKGSDGQYYGGPMQYMEKGLGSKPLAMLFSALCVAASFGIGNMAQVHAAAQMVEQAFQVSPVWIGALMAGICAIVLLGGAKRIAALNEKLVPAMGLFYIAGALLCLCCRFDRIGRRSP